MLQMRPLCFSGIPQIKLCLTLSLEKADIFFSLFRIYLHSLEESTHKFVILGRFLISAAESAFVGFLPNTSGCNSLFPPPIRFISERIPGSMRRGLGSFWG